MKDWIICGETGKAFAQVDIHRDEDLTCFYAGEILQYNFPCELAMLIDEYNELVNAMVLSLLDEVEERICSYDLRLVLLQTKIFSPCIKDKKTIELFTKYPTSNGFVDDRPFYRR